MSNPYNNEIIFNGQTLMSLKEDTVMPNKVLAGETFHDRSGAPQTGTLITHNVYDDLDSTSTNDALSANQGRILNEKYDTLNRKITYFSLILYQTLTNGYVTYNVISGRSLSDYEVIIISPDMGGWYNNSCVIPGTTFINATGVNTFYHDVANVIEVDVKYVSDTSISAKYIGTPSGNVHLNMYGILKK